MTSFNILSKKDRKTKLKTFSALKSAFEKGTLKLTNRAKRIEVEESKSKALTIYLIGILRKSSIDFIFAGYELLVEISPSNELVFPDSLDSIADAFAEILISRCYLIDRAFWEVQCRRGLADKNLLPDTLNSERFGIIDGVLAGASEAYGEFCGLLGLGAEAADPERFAWRLYEKFWRLYENRFKEYSEMDYFPPTKNDTPKGTFYWEAGKRIANAMVGGPDILIVGLATQTSHNLFIGVREFLAAYFEVPLKPIETL